MKRVLTSTALALAASSVALGAVPAEARRHHRGDDRYAHYERRGYSNYTYGEPVYGNTPVWRGRDGNYYCRKHDGTTGVIVGAAAGALLGNSVAGNRDKTLGTVLGGAIGALLGKRVTQDSRCN